MKPAPFKLHIPDNEQEILALLSHYGRDARVLAGGQSFVPLMNMRIMQPEALISLNRCASLAYINQHNGGIAIGARTRQAEVEDSVLIASDLPLLSKTMPYVGVRAIRNFGTICGSLAHADPLAELPGVAAALDARFEIASVRGTREVGADEFYVSALSNCLEPDEMLRQICFPEPPANSSSVFLEVSTRSHGFAVVGMALSVSIDDKGVCSNARLAAIGVGETPLRLTSAETMLEGNVLNDELTREVSAVATEPLEPPGDIHASGGYRKRVAGNLIKKALSEVGVRSGLCL